MPSPTIVEVSNVARNNILGRPLLPFRFPLVGLQRLPQRASLHSNVCALFRGGL